MRGRPGGAGRVALAGWRWAAGATGCDHDEVTEIPCVGAVVRDRTGRLLVVRRGRPPGQGLWSLPGGRVEPGEDDAAAVVREVAEETGLAVAAGELVGMVRREAPGGGTYVIRDYACTPLPGPGEPVAGDDAAEARWVSDAELRALPTTDGLVAALSAWGVLSGDGPVGGRA